MNRVLVVGCGSIGRRHIGNFKAAGVTHIVGADTRQDRLDQADAQLGLAGGYLDYVEALERETFDAVVVALPPHLHTPVAKLAMEKGCHIFMEKPLAKTLDGLDELQRIADEQGVVFFTAYCYRFIPYARKLKELVDEGRIGRVLSGRLELSTYLPDWHPWEDYRTFYMASEEQGGGALLDESHGIDLLRWVLGEVRAVSAMVDRVSDLEITSDDVAALLLRFESGVVVSAHFDLLGRTPRLNLELIGSEGTLLWDRVSHRIELYDVAMKRWEVYPYGQADLLAMYPAEVEHFLECVREGKRPLIDLEDGRRTLEVLLAAFQSSEQGRVVEPASLRS